MLFRKLPARYAPAVMPFVLSILTIRIVSTISTLCRFGAGAAFVSASPSASLLSWLMAFPTLLAVLPLARRIVALLVAPSGPPARGWPD